VENFKREGEDREGGELGGAAEGIARTWLASEKGRG